MYERFTERSRKVMVLANQEAQRFSHEYIGTEHILLGLVKEGSGVGATVLKQRGLSLEQIRNEVERLVKSSDVASIGKVPYTPRTKKVIEYAIDEARKLNHNYVGTEHVLLGLLRVQEGVASEVLRNLGMTFEVLRDDVMFLLGECGTQIKTIQAIRDLRKWQESYMDIFEVAPATMVRGCIESIVQIVEKSNEDNSSSDEE